MLHRCLAPLVLTLPLAAQTITFAEGSATDLTIVSVAEASPNGPDAVVLANVELLPIEITGRTLAQENDRTRSRRIDRHGLARVELPAGGRLFRYKRAGGQFWGFLRIDPTGSAHVVFERPGVGATLDDPFFDRIAVSPDGRHAAIALQAGGLRLARLDGTVFPSTGTAVRTVASSAFEVLPLSVMLGDTTLWYQTTDHVTGTDVFGCSVADLATPILVTPPAVPNGDFKDQMAITPDGSRVVFLYGPTNQMRLFTATLATGAVQLPAPPSKYEEPGFLPEQPGEPAMLLNDTGTRLFCVDAQVRDELQLLDLTGALPPLPITESTIFQPYIGSHILPKFAADKLVVAIGDIAAMDWFAAELAPAGGTVANLTGTGSLLQPFPSGTLDPQQAATVAGKLLLSEGTPGGLALRQLDPVTGATAVLRTDLLAAPVVGDALVGAADVVVRTAGGVQLFEGVTGSLFAAIPPGLDLAPTVHGPWYAATVVSVPNAFGVATFYAGGQILFGPIETGIEQLVLTPLGGTVVVSPQLRYLAPGVSIALNRPAVAMRVCLSGAGA